MRYNFNDSWSVIFDDNGKPLRGKIEFCEVNTTDLKPIYSVDGYELPNPIYCNERPTYQINVDEGDYTVRYYRYIGNGNMESDQSESSWLLYKTANLHNESITATHESKITTVDNVVSMMNIEGMVPGDIAHVLGYHNVNDGCPDRYFVWHSENKTPDGGIVFTSLRTTAGHWKMVIPGSYIDVRWFGDIPDESATPAQQTSNLGQRTKAAQAANTYGKDLYFPHSNETNTFAYYIFDGSNTVSIDGDIYCDNGVRFVVKDGTSGTRVSCNQLHKAEKHLFTHQTQDTENPGRFSLVSDWVNTSWLTSNEASGNARYGYVIDELKSPLAFSNTKLKVDKNFIHDSFSIDNVDIVECYKKITNNCTLSIKNMDIHTEWFADSFNYTTNLLNQGNCTVKLHNCKDANTYIDIKNKLGQNDYGDLGEQEIDNRSLLPGAIVENCFGSFTISNVSSSAYEFHNVTATLNAPSSLSMTGFNCTDCWLTFNTNSSGPLAIANLSIRRGNLNSNSTLTILENLYLDNVDIYSSLATEPCDTAVIKNCIIHNALDTTNISIYNSEIYARITTYNIGTVIDFNLIGNKFLAGDGHHITSTVQNTVVNGKWVDNYSKLQYHFIVLDRTNLNSNENSHWYEYYDNKGPNVLQKIGKKYYPGVSIYPESSTLPADCLYFEIQSGVQCSIWAKGHPFTIEFFSVGTTGITKQLKVNACPGQYIPGVGNESKGQCTRIDTNEWAPVYQFPTKWKPLTTFVYPGSTFANLVFNSDYTWKFTYGSEHTQGSALCIAGDDGERDTSGYKNKDFWTKNISETKYIWFFMELE